MSEDQDSLVDFVGGDAEGARSLRRALEALRDAAEVAPEDRSVLVRRSTAIAAESDRDQRWPSAREPAEP